MKPTFGARAGGAAQKIQQQFDAASREADRLTRSGQPEAGLVHATRQTQLLPKHPNGWLNQAVCLTLLGREAEAIAQAQKALACGGASNFIVFDTLAHACGQAGRSQDVRYWGLQALQMRQQRFTPAKPPALPPAPLPPAPSQATRAHNLIAFSLFGDLPKYCETAVLNAQAQPQIYPDWSCVFYLDASVPAHVTERLTQAGARCQSVGPERAKRWPGPMWRLLALDEPGLHRVIFRDADSVINPREAAAVAQWLDSGRYFHMMRDSYSHTELILAGLWGAVGGVLPPVTPLVDAYLRKPIPSRHFADQYFLREAIWPWLHQSLLQHDSQFGFMQAEPFTGPQLLPGQHVGGCDANSRIDATLPGKPDGAHVAWQVRLAQPPHTVIFGYTSVVKNQAITIELSSDFVRRIQQGQWQFHLP